MPYGYAARRKTVIHDARRRNVNLGTIPPELKYLDCGNSPAAQPTSPSDGVMSGGEMQPTWGVTGCLTCPSVGDGPSNRDGKHINILSVQFHAIVTWPLQNSMTAASTKRAPMFLALVWDNQANAATINSEDVFQIPNTLNSPELNAAPFRNPNHGRRFQVLKSWTVMPPTADSFHDGTDGASNTLYKHISFYTKCHVPIAFNTGTTADVANISDKALHVIAYSAIVDVNLHWMNRIRFIG